VHGLPVPGQEFGNAPGGVVGDSSEHVGEVMLRVEAEATPTTISKDSRSVPGRLDNIKTDDKRSRAQVTNELASRISSYWSSGRIEDRGARFGERKLYRICW
jgi:hypothetical protein